MPTWTKAIQLGSMKTGALRCPASQPRDTPSLRRAPHPLRPACGIRTMPGRLWQSVPGKTSRLLPDSKCSPGDFQARACCPLPPVWDSPIGPGPRFPGALHHHHHHKLQAGGRRQSNPSYRKVRDPSPVSHKDESGPREKGRVSSNKIRQKADSLSTVFTNLSRNLELPHGKKTTWS